MAKAALILFILLSSLSPLAAQDKERQWNINSIFEKMESMGVDTRKPLLYGFFFYDKDKAKLEKLSNALLKERYKLVRLEKTDGQNFILHVEKVEVHSRASLLARESQLDKLSKTYQIASYDGWDVGNADPTKPLVSDDSFGKSLEGKSDVELYTIANNLYDNEEREKAIVVFQQCIDRNFRLDTCYYKQGVSYIDLGKVKTGIEKLENAVKISPTYFKACFNIGAACYDNHEFKKSIEYYQKAASLEPKEDRVFYGLAASQFVLGQLEEATVNCQTALKLNPSNENARNLLERINKKNK